MGHKGTPLKFSRTNTGAWPVSEIQMYIHHEKFDLEVK